MFRLLLSALMAASGFVPTPGSDSASLYGSTTGVSEMSISQVADNIMFGPADVYFDAESTNLQVAQTDEASSRMSRPMAFVFGPFWSGERLTRSIFERNGDLYDDFSGLLEEEHSENPFASGATGEGWDRPAASSGVTASRRPAGNDRVARPLFQGSAPGQQYAGGGSGGSLFPLPASGSQGQGGGDQVEAGLGNPIPTVAPVPLPTTLPLLLGALGLAGVAGLRRRRG